MKSPEKSANKELYHELRRYSCEQLWVEEVPRFNQAPPAERNARVALIRAVGVVFSESGAAAQQAEARVWLRSLLHDPAEKIRRYAMLALPRLGADTHEETELLTLLRTTTSAPEKKFLGQTLAKIGGTATLAEVATKHRGAFLPIEQKVRAHLARDQSPSTVRLERPLTHYAGLRIHLRGRQGLEQIVRAEIEDSAAARKLFRVAEVRRGLVALVPLAPFCLADIYALRCFGTVGFVLGVVGNTDELTFSETLARAISSRFTQRLFENFTEGALRYRLDFVAQGHLRGVVRRVVNRAYVLCPDILNDSHSAPWTISIYPSEHGSVVELCPAAAVDVRFAYRQQDMPAASHPPLAASIARLAGRGENEIVWDPFCGCGLELIERARLGGVQQLYGTDHDAKAMVIAQNNFVAANVSAVKPQFLHGDFRDFAQLAGLGSQSLTQIITNPPMGKRVPIANLNRLIEELFFIAAELLKSGGQLVFANPLHLESPDHSLKLLRRQIVDFGGFNCRLEKYQKLAK